jgi:membrane-associated phospholipid phosphatase
VNKIVSARFGILKSLILGIGIGLGIAASICGQAYAGKSAWDKYSDVGAVGIPLAAGIITLTKDDNEGVFQLGESYLLTLGATYGLKYTVHEQRPEGGAHSFPSTHSSSAFAGASYLMFRYGWEYGVPAYIAASAVAWSRVDNHHHHWQDVIASAAIANISAYFLTDRFEERVAVLPVVDPQNKSFGLVAAARF